MEECIYRRQQEDVLLVVWTETTKDEEWTRKEKSASEPNILGWSVVLFLLWFHLYVSYFYPTSQVI